MVNRRDAEGAEGTGKNEDGLSHEVIGGAIEVHRRLGPGLLESVYEGALCRELYLRGIDVRRQVPLPLEYKGVDLGVALRLDLVVERRLIVEVKSAHRHHPIYLSQMLTYLELTGLPLGLLINFNVSVLRSGIRRVINRS